MCRARRISATGRGGASLLSLYVRELWINMVVIVQGGQDEQICFQLLVVFHCKRLVFRFSTKTFVFTPGWLKGCAIYGVAGNVTHTLTCECINCHMTNEMYV